MTIASETSRVNLVGNGVNDTFTFTFEIYVKTDLLVYVDGTRQTVDINYTVPDDAIENPDGGTVVFGAEHIPADLAIVSIILNLPYTQLIDYVEADKFPAETHERGLDRLIKIAQQLRERSLRQPILLESSQYSDLTLPDPVASKLLAWKDDLSGIKNVEVESEGDLLVTDFIKTLIDDEDATAARITLFGAGAAYEFYPEKYGATGDGVTDDAIALQAAIDAAEAVNGKVRFMAPLYITGIQLDVRNPISILGEGTTIKQKDGSNITSVLDITVSGSEDVYVRIKVDGNMGNNTAVNGILISGPQTAYANIMAAAKDCDNGIVIQGNTESNTFFFDVAGCTIGVLERYVSGATTPDENTYFISGHNNGTHYKKSCATGGRISSIIHFSCEAASAEAVNITTVDNVSITTLNGEVRGCASHGVIIDDAAGAVKFNNLIIDGNDTASSWGLRIDNIGRLSGLVGISNFAGGLWVKECSSSCSLQVHTSALAGTEAGVQLGDSGGATSAQRFVLTSGSYINASASTNAVHFDNAFHCVAHLSYVTGLTYDVLMDNDSANNVVYANGRNITLSKYLDLTASARDNRFVFEGEYLATFTDSDTTPSVLGYSSFLTNTTGITITQFDNGYAGQIISIISKGAIVYDTSTASRLIGSSVDITTAAGDVTTWVCEISGTTGSCWRLLGFVDVSENNSAGA